MPRNLRSFLCQLCVRRLQQNVARPGHGHGPGRFRKFHFFVRHGVTPIAFAIESPRATMRKLEYPL